MWWHDVETWQISAAAITVFPLLDILKSLQDDRTSGKLTDMDDVLKCEPVHNSIAKLHRRVRRLCNLVRKMCGAHIRLKHHGLVKNGKLSKARASPYNLILRQLARTSHFSCLISCNGILGNRRLELNCAR
jgi:hypothetical protein